ncbi:MAG: hypothetical protein KDC12_14185, partial [Flavobacteriales bacterium]|nr:hypothetical protein [Flavobacteriales bacterium]
MEQTYCSPKQMSPTWRSGLYVFLSILLTSLTVQMSAQRVTEALVSLYTFHEGSGNVVHDVSGFQSAEDLYIDNTSNVTWLSGGGLSIDAGTILKTSAPATKQYNALSPSPEISFEFWVTQEDDSQNGPARIMTMSANTGARNYTIGQENYDYIARLRTNSGSTDNNGLPNSDADINIDESLQHFVYTIDGSGTEKWYVNGVLTDTDYRAGNFTNWNNSYYFALANEMTMDRPWLGDYHLVAVYCQALDQNDVLQNYNAGPDQNQTVCNTITNGSSPYPDTDPIFQQVIAMDSYCCDSWWDNICQNEYDDLYVEPTLEETCTITGYDSPTGRIFWIPEFGTDFKASSSGLFLDKFSDGTAHMYGSVKRISDSNAIFAVDLWFNNMSTYNEWLAQGMAAKNPNLGDETTWIFYNFDDTHDNTLIGSGNLSGVVIYLDDTPDQYGLQIGDGANALNSNANGLSTWFDYTGTNSGSGDINGTIDCGSTPDCDNLVVLDQWSQTSSCQICEDSFTSTINSNYGGANGDVIDFEDPICNPGECVTAVTVTFNVAAADFDLSTSESNVDQINTAYPIEINGYVIGYYDPTELPYICNLCESDESKTVTFPINSADFPYNFGGTNTFDSNFYQYGNDNGILQDVCVANIVLQFETGPCTTTCDNVTNAGSICCDQAGCAPFDPSEITSSQLPSGGSGALEYVWLSNTTGPNTAGATTINHNSATYNPGALTQTTWFRRCARRAGCTDYVGESNWIKMTVTDGLTVETMTEDANCGACDGAVWVFTEGGSTPYSYLINGQSPADYNIPNSGQIDIYSLCEGDY